MDLESDFLDLVHLGGARITEAELKRVLDLAAEYEALGSANLRQVVACEVARRNLGLIVEPPFEGLD
jgi:hypothetical protein